MRGMSRKRTTIDYLLGPRTDEPGVEASLSVRANALLNWFGRGMRLTTMKDS
jgi:hypothetical protein